jgi:teichuronic acid biosynthesis glycosyltransferase TuaC
MRISVVTNMWPTAALEWSGIYVEREVEALRGFTDVDVDVVHVATTQGLWRYVAGWPAVRRRLQQFRPDVVHFHYGLSQLLSPSWGGASVVTFHGSDLRVPLQRRLSLASLRVHPQRAVITVAEELLDGVPVPLRVTRYVRVIPCGVDVRRFKPMEKTMARQRLNLATEGPVIMFPASPRQHVKNYPLFREAVERLRPMLDADPTVILLDGVNPEEAALRFAAADVVVLTSHREGSPLVVKEALACHRPVVSVAVGDLRRYTQGTLPCAVCATRDPDKLADLVREALNVNESAFDSVPVPTLDAEAVAVLELYRALVESADPRWPNRGMRKPSRLTTRQPGIGGPLARAAKSAHNALDTPLQSLLMGT